MATNLLKTLYCLAFSTLLEPALPQEIQFQNPSFEGFSGYGRTPRNWYACESPGYTPPDIQPGEFGCTTPARDGKTYLGMVIRDDLTFEGVGQQLPTPLDSGRWYNFSAHLAKSPDYWSTTKYLRIQDPATGKFRLIPNNKVEINYNQVAVFQVWGSYGHCDLEVLLAETPPIEHPDWKIYSFNIRHDLSKPITHLIFQAYFSEKDRCIGAHGNVLLDHLSALKMVEANASFPEPKLTIAVEKSSPVSLDLDSTDSILRQAFNAVDFKSRYPYFELNCRTDDSGLMFLENPALETVVTLLRQQPELHIFFAVKKRHSKMLVPFLEDYFLRKRAIPPAQLRVEKMEKNDQTPAVFENEYLKVAARKL